MNNGLPAKHVLEVVIVAIILLCSLHLLEERIARADLPGGDAGSWMSAAAEFSRGHGFTTRWYEHPFLYPAALPRPDDYRYPGLVLTLALVFAVSGVGYAAALWTVAGIFILYLLVIYLVCRRAFDARTAVLTMAVSAASLLQLCWNTQVYSEGLFGLVAGVTILWAISRQDRTNMSYWVVLGLLCGALYNVRPNGVLFGLGIIWLYIRERKNGVRIGLPLAALASMGAMMAPYMVRAWVVFGNPLHVAGNGGLLGANLNDPSTFTVRDFVSQHGWFAPFVNLIDGFVPFWEALNYFEHGLFVIPLIGLIAGLAMRRRFYSPFVSCSLLVTFIACIYISCPMIGSWAGVRYCSPILPFAYGYGIHSLLSLADSRLRTGFPRVLTWLAAAVFGVLLLSPVYYPHRYYERTLRGTPKKDLSYSEHLKSMNSLLARNDAYFANRMCQLNFLTEYRCVGLQQYVDSTQVKRLMERFRPKLLVLTPSELQDDRIAAVLREIGNEGYVIDEADRNRLATYYRIRRGGPEGGEEAR